MPALEDADRSSPVLAPAAHSSRLVRRGALALLIGGPLSLVFHVLWKVGHGTTVVNEHGVVLGLTNDQWSYLSAFWTVPVAVGVVTACSLHRGRLSRVAAVLTVLGLALNTVAAFVWELYSIGGLVLNAGVLCLSIMILRGGVLSPWSAWLLLLALIAFIPLAVVNDAVLSLSTNALPFRVQGEDVIVFLSALAWTALGVALFRVSRLPEAAYSERRAGIARRRRGEIRGARP
jgi:hypothetical protein